MTEAAMAAQRRHSAQYSDADRMLITLGEELRRLRERCRRLKREAEVATTTAAWQTWSEEVARLEALFAQIAKCRMSTLQDVATRYQALAVELIDNDLILERGARRRVARLNRDLQQLTRRRLRQQ
jgi:hypothetical protein